MRLSNRTLLTASAFLAVSLVTAVSGGALAQVEDTEEVEIVEIADDPDTEEALPDEEHVDLEEAEATEESELSPDAEQVQEAVAVADPEAVDATTAGEVALVTPGSTDESNPGGSTRPGTTPND